MPPDEESPGRASGRPAGADAASEIGVTSKGVWGLAWPTMVVMGCATVVRMTDFAMIRELGPSATAAVGVAGNFYWLIECITQVVAAGLTAILARAVGAGDRLLMDRSFRQSQSLGLLLGVASIAAVAPFTHAAIALYGVESDVVEIGSDYLWWRLWGTLPLFVTVGFATALRAAGDVRTPLEAGVVGAGVNVFGNWVLIDGNLGAPALGVTGAAIASDLAFVVTTAHFVVLWLGRRLVIEPSGGSWWPEREMTRRLLRIGLPAALEGVTFQMGLLLFQRLMAFFGTEVIAAYNIGSMLLGVSFIPGVGFSLAASTLVGQYLGARDPDRSEAEGARANRMAVLTMTAVGIALAIFARPIAAGFSTDAEVIELTVIALRIFGLAHPFMAVEFALGGALRGAGDTIFPMITVFTGLIVVRLGLALGLITFLDAPIGVVWSVLVIDYVLKSIMLVVRFRRGGWKDRKV